MQSQQTPDLSDFNTLVPGSAPSVEPGNIVDCSNHDATTPHRFNR